MGLSQIHYGWRVVGATFSMLAFSSGFGFYFQSVLLEALISQRGFSVAAASFATTVFFAVSGVAGLGVAYLIERIDIRYTILGGSLLASISLVLIGRASTPAQVTAAFALFGLGFTCTGMLTGTTLVTRWFSARRATAMAIASTGLSMGGVLLTPFAARATSSLGLRDAMPLVALILFLGIVPLSLFVLRDRPESIGETAYGAGRESDRARPQREVGQLRDALRSRFFVCVALAFLLGLLGQVGGIAHQFRHVAGVAGLEWAGAAVSLLAASSIIGRFLASSSLSFIASRPLTVTLAFSQAAALTMLGQAQTKPALLVLTCAFGLTVGSFLLMQPLLLAEAFGVRHYARIFAIASLIGAVGVAAGPSVIGWAHDHWGGYSIAFAVAGSSSALAGICLLLAGPMTKAT